MIIPDEWVDDRRQTPTEDLETALGFADDWVSPVAFDVDQFPATKIDLLPADAYKQVHEWYVSYGGSFDDGYAWKPGDYCGTELTMVVLVELHDGRWASVNAWNDYTGWGCQDDAQIRVGSRENVIRYGLDNEGRKLLGITLDAA